VIRIRLRVFVSSVQKELQEERAAIATLLATDPFLSSCTVPRLFEEYPAPLKPNKRAYLDLLRSCHIYLLIIGKEYRAIAKNELSATHEEYRLARELRLPVLVCVKGDNTFQREPEEAEFFEETKKDGYNYSRFASIQELTVIVRDRLVEYIEQTFEIRPTIVQNEVARETIRAASDFEKQQITSLSFSNLRLDLMTTVAAAAEEQDPDDLNENDVRHALASRAYLWFEKRTEDYRPTAASVLLFAPQPSRVFPQSRIQLDAFAGVDRESTPIDNKLLDAPLSEAIDQTVAFIRRHSNAPLQVEGIKRKRTEAYPQAVLREAVVNAVAHRNYEEEGAKVVVEVFSDRVVISSPGMPPGNQNVARINSGRARSRLRNPLIVQGLNLMELMDERGSGITRMRSEMQQQGLPFPVFSLNEDEFTVTLHSKTDKEEKEETEDTPPAVESITDRQNEILRRAISKGSITTAECVRELGIVKDTAWRDIKDLMEKGFLRKEGTGRSSRYVPVVSDRQTQIGRKSDESSTENAGTSENRTKIGRKSDANRTQK
jgi:ATP-dependent DNA helicase RecG